VDDDVGAVEQGGERVALEDVPLAVFGSRPAVLGRVEREASLTTDLPMSPVGPVTATVRPIG